MSDLLDIKMPQQPEPEPEVQEEVQEEVQSAQAEEESEEEPPPKEYIPDEEVFNAPQVKKVKKKCSEKQLAHLAKIRQKALAKKQENKRFLEEQRAKQERYRRAEQAQEPKKPRRKKKVYVPAEPEEEIEYIYDDHPDHPDHQPQPLPQMPVRQEPQFQGYQLTPAQIKQLQRDAIMDYEVIRKERKQHERLAQEQQYIEQERRKIMKQMGSPDNDPWSQCFN